MFMETRFRNLNMHVVPRISQFRTLGHERVAPELHGDFLQMERFIYIWKHALLLTFDMCVDGLRDQIEQWMVKVSIPWVKVNVVFAQFAPRSISISDLSYLPFLQDVGCQHQVDIILLMIILKCPLDIQFSCISVSLF